MEQSSPLGNPKKLAGNPDYSKARELKAPPQRQPMNKLLTTLLLSLLVTFVQAQQTQYRDALGQPVGTSYSFGGSTTYRNADGSIAGTSFSSGGTTQSYGSNGAPSASAMSGDPLVSPVIVPVSVFVPIGEPVVTGR